MQALMWWWRVWESSSRWWYEEAALRRRYSGGWHFRWRRRLSGSPGRGGGGRFQLRAPLLAPNPIDGQATVQISPTAIFHRDFFSCCNGHNKERKKETSRQTLITTSPNVVTLGPIRCVVNVSSRRVQPKVYGRISYRGRSMIYRPSAPVLTYKLFAI